MEVTNNRRGALLWLDDAFTDDVIAEAERRGNLWGQIFGSRNSRLFRLMELSLELGRDHLEAAAIIDRWTQGAGAGTHVFAIVDLTIPPAPGEIPAVKFGIDVAARLRSRRVPFVFLSRNTDASRSLEQARLATVPYYVKSDERWRLPDGLAANVINEFSNRISWISLFDLVATMHPESTLAIRAESARGERGHAVIEHYPYFGVFRDFVDRWELTQRVELPRVSSIRASRDDSDEHVQQSLALVFHDRFLRQPGQIRFLYRSSANREAMREIEHLRDDPATVAVIRVEADELGRTHLEHELEAARRRPATTVFVVPRDESADPVLEILAAHRIPSIGEVPGIPDLDDRARRELATRVAALVLQQWAGVGPAPIQVHRGWLAHPHLMINPVHWMALVESRTVAEKLSDPYELVSAMYRALDELGQDPASLEIFVDCLQNGNPIPWNTLLRVGDLVLTERPGQHTGWWVRALRAWLTTSWQYPHGVGLEFARGSSLLEDDRVESVGDWERPAETQGSWEDNAFEILVGLCNYADERHLAVPESPEIRRVLRFVRQLGGQGFLLDPERVNWEELESMRWPHHQFPMPRAVSRRLRDIGRVLWIHPEGLDVAAVLPESRHGYRALTATASHYCDILDWADEVTPLLPLGWGEHVSFLASAIRTHTVGALWGDPSGRLQLWDQLVGLLRNGAPVLYTVHCMVAGEPLVGTKAAQQFLSGVQGYGKILGPVRASRPARMALFRERGTGRTVVSELSRDARVLLGMLPPDGWERVSEALKILVGSVAEGASTDVLDLYVRSLTDPTLALGSGTGWDRTQGKPGKLLRDGQLASAFQTKESHVWKTIDVLSRLGSLTQSVRYCDGYQVLSAILELRLMHKDSAPQISLETINTVAELFLQGIQGLVAHLAVCLEVAGRSDLAQPITATLPRTLDLPEEVIRPDQAHVDAILRVVGGPGESFAVYSLGIPGNATADRLCYHGQGEVHLL